MNTMENSLNIKDLSLYFALNEILNFDLTNQTYSFDDRRRSFL